MQAKTTFTFGQDRWGWQEVYYYDEVDGTLATALTNSLALATLRIGILSRSVFLESVSVANLVNKRSAIRRFNVEPNASPGTLVSQEPWEVAMFDLNGYDAGGNRFTRKLMMRGIPAVWNTWSQASPLNPVVNPNFKVAYTAFLDALAGTGSTGAGRWCIRGRNRTTNPANSAALIGVSLEPLTGRFIVTTDATRVFTAGERVHIYTTRNHAPRGLAGDAYVLARIGLSAEYVVNRRPSCPGNSILLEGPALMKVTGISLIPITAGYFDRFVKRDTGRALFGTRGRQQASSC
jgi:hypothetical protein